MSFENDLKYTFFLKKIRIYKLLKYNLSDQSSVTYFQDYEIINYKMHNVYWTVDFCTRFVQFLSSGSENRLVWLIKSCDSNSLAACHNTLS